MIAGISQAANEKADVDRIGSCFLKHIKAAIKESIVGIIPHIAPVV
jgi:hypothetical protein